ncbi:RNA polymerase sigma factor [Dysgonomonas sp. BGC7]|uniref:RNA polymerase sigma factor n=1 Tax=Dysgonomonas sp. BGC7 TaxID=1658008 RepID=UPI00067F9231|nr:sigma-70 family RNA polymerase sigma factor [Dysgonomonas sp. BGC7]MBD8390469.1 sigma-70 family RNA polymerase sigma factor [Dysgonomonas sp. BGC7]
MKAEQKSKDIEEYLICQLKSGSHQAFETLYYKYSGKLYNFVNTLLNDAVIAKDITQHSFLRIWEFREHIDSDTGSFSGYLFQIAKNEVYKESERQLRVMLITNLNDYEISSKDETIRKIDNEILNVQIEKLLNDLPPARKEIFLMRRNSHLTNKEIAVKLNISEKTVETQIHRTIKYLKSKLIEVIN